jgi:tRNA A-37 threonylcarbamoyl transferase component Bud32
VTTRVTISTMSNAASALHADEVKRTRALLRVGWVVAAVAAIAIVLTPGNAQLGMVLLATLAACVAGSAWLYAWLREAEHSTWQMNALALACVIAAALGILYVGVFSAAPTMLGLGLYFFCRSESRASAIAIYAIGAGAHALEGTLVLTGAIHDPGFYRTGHTLMYAQILGQASMQVLYAVIFWLARVTRAASLQSIGQLQKATRLAAQREIQLAELRSDLDRALEIGGPGRYTGVVVGSWELGNVLGRGAMGEVYEAARADGEGEAAVKLLRRELLADPHHVERFLREVRVASAIDSPHVVRVLEASTPVDALPFLAMELLRGQTLSKLLAKGRSLADTSLARLVTDVGSVLELARAAGIVHRDIKPQNLFLTFDDVWKVLDFGVALLADTSGTLTRGHAVGTPAYMSPEQASGTEVDHRADLYSLGAVIYRCATGRAPYAGRDTPALLYAVVHDMPLRPSAIAPVSPQLEQFLTVALAKSPDARFQSASELIAAFSSPTPELARRARTLQLRNPWR